ncbi:MAG TPA: hypothetical protein VFN88_11690 [Caulobacteraceae bacterium]|nr:hypothetical protein [Caulobacteraceae bacterium]
MAELFESGEPEVEAGAAVQTDTSAVAIALDRARRRKGRAGANDEVDRFLEKQEALIDDQRAHLHGPDMRRDRVIYTPVCGWPSQEWNALIADGTTAHFEVARERRIASIIGQAQSMNTENEIETREVSGLNL